MIVATQFPGDSYEVASAQHDVYAKALGIIVKCCNRYAVFAKRVFDSDEFQSWGTIYKFDHRVLQFQHDMLATVWRYETQASQRRLDCEEDVQSVQERWLDWLDAEVHSWIDRPEWVRLVQIILSNQNTPYGQRTETVLSLQIMAYFPEVPWSLQLKRAFELEIEKGI